MRKNVVSAFVIAVSALCLHTTSAWAWGSWGNHKCLTDNQTCCEAEEVGSVAFTFLWDESANPDRIVSSDTVRVQVRTSCGPAWPPAYILGAPSTDNNCGANCEVSSDSCVSNDVYYTQCRIEMN